jgi:ribonuclease HI
MPGRKKTIRDFLVSTAVAEQMIGSQFTPPEPVFFESAGTMPISFHVPAAAAAAVPPPPPQSSRKMIFDPVPKSSGTIMAEDIIRKIHTVPVFTDGGTWGNGRADSRGSYAVYIPPIDGLPEVTIMDRYYGTPVTNNRCELAAISMALKFMITNAHIFRGKHIRLYSDSEYAIKSLTQYIGAWKRNGWKKADGKPVMNTDMIREIDELIQIITRTIVEILEFVHVRSHQSEPRDKNTEKWLTWYGNDRADKMTGEILRRTGPVSAIALRGH